MDLKVHSVSLLMNAAAIALANRDTAALDSLAELSGSWTQGKDEAAAQQLLLLTMIEASDMLQETPSQLDFAGDARR